MTEAQKALKNQFKKYAKLLENHPLLRILDSLSKLGIVFAAIFWILEIDDRKKERENQNKQRTYRAWEIITASELMPSSPARKYALEDLVNAKHMPEAIELYVANLDSANLEGASFKESNLGLISFYGANLRRANFDFCFIDEVDFGDAKLENATFKGAVIRNSNFSSVLNRNDLDFSDAIILNARGLRIKNKLVDSTMLLHIKKIWKKPSDYMSDEDLELIIKKLDSILNQKNY